MAKKAAAASGESTKSKADVIREFLAQGMKSPAQIAAAAKEVGFEISPNHVSMVKSSLKKAKRAKRRLVRASGDMQTAAVKGRRAAETDLSLENLALRFALQAGSVQAAIASLQKLQR